MQITLDVIFAVIAIVIVVNWFFVGKNGQSRW